MQKPERLNLLNWDPHVGRRLLRFTDSSFDVGGGERLVLNEWWVVQNNEGRYGVIAGGSKNIECFVNWLLDAGGYCFNPVNLDGFQWSRANNAFMYRSTPTVLIETPLVVGGHYVFTPRYHSEDLKTITLKRSLGDCQTVWELPPKTS